MNLSINGHHLEVTPALRTYVTTKLDRITPVSYTHLTLPTTERV